MSLRVTVELVLCMVLWGGSWIAGRVVGETVEALPAAFLRYVFASITLVTMVRVARGGIPPLPRALIGRVVFLGATGILGYSTFFFEGLRHIPAARAALIVACTPVAISVASAVLYRERFGPLRVSGTLTALVGVSIVIADGDPRDLLAGGFGYGDLMILGCVASWTSYSIGGRAVMRTLDPLPSVMWSAIAGTLLMLPLAFVFGVGEAVHDARPIDWANLVFLGAGATAVAYLWYYRAIAVVGPSRTGVFINTVPVFAAIGAWLLLDEPIGPSLLVGGALVIAGVVMTNRRRRGPGT